MTTTAAAENLAGRAGEKEKDKVEKRRALGRGLESLLPGPRVVAGTAAGSAPQSPPFAKNAKDGAPTGPQTSPIAKSAQDGAPTVLERKDGAGHSDTTAEAFSGSIQAIAEDVVAEAAELRSAGQPGAAVPTPDETITISAQAESRVPGNLVVNLPIEDIDKNPFQTRYVSDDDALEELSNSIRTNGVVQPILVRPAEEDGRYILILGERRLHASVKAGKTTIPALVRRVSLQQAAEMTIVENLQREDLSPLEQAEAFRVLSQDFHLTQAQIGERVGLSRESIANYMRLLKLPREVMQLLAEKRIKFAEAKELLKLNGDDQISKAAIYMVNKGLSLEQVERMVLSMNGLLDPFPGMPGQVVKKKEGGARWVDPNVRAAQVELERLLGVRVKIRDRKGKGKIVIEYHTVDDFERVMEMLHGKK